MKHAALRIKCVDGIERAFGTLCGLDVATDQKGTTTNPVEVECRRCRKAVAWKTFVDKNNSS